MKTHEEQLAFAEENSRLTKRFGEIADAMEALILAKPADEVKFLELLHERLHVTTAMRRLTDEYLNK